SVGEPDIKGHLELNDAAVTLKGDKFPPVENAGLAIDFVPDKVELKNLRATIAGGALSGGGTLALDEWKPGELDIRITGNKLPVVRNESIIVRSNLNLRLAGPFETATLSGGADVVDSLFYQDIELIPIGVPFTGPSAASLPKIDPPDQKAEQIPAPFGDWKLDLRIRTAEPFLIRGNLATGEVDVDLKIGGTAGNPAPDGFARLRNVTALLPFSTLRVREGWVRFNPANGLDPVLEIRGTANPKPYRVNAFVYGNASNPQIVLTSSPPLPENEIMTLLATGTTTSGLEDPQMASSRAIQLLVEELRRGRLGGSERLRPLLGLLDRVEFTLSDKNPYTSENYTSATIALTDKWFLAASMGEENNTRLMGIWRLTFR
ncbi:MAG: translocation/assembly module TamB domain-containing protein, partial [Verrucomicrobiae bacterium]|nr:translocation/assembly module TamB domain-containing protein [Verrucomicrobiae bacterium]